MDERFLRAVEIVLEHEKGYVNDPEDPGGETNWGICKRQYPHLDIKNLKREEAAGIYYTDYWLSGRWDKIRHEALAVKCFDLGVTMGNGQITKCLQRALAALGLNTPDDGKIGPQTIAYANAYPHKDALVAGVKYFAEDFYLKLHKARFLAGWWTRADD